MRHSLAIAVSLALASGSAQAIEKWGPTWSEVTGTQWSRTAMNREGAVISKVDGRQATDRIVKVEPGKRSIVVRSPMRKGLAGTDATLDLDVEPCKRYYLNAQFKGGTGRDWEPVIAHVETVAGCKLAAR